ncbi:hypothetical protein MMC14_008417 [Varicellaria rhodocarpa]|nr:hypothetical protein [Varicellaria rhodocarpa]
MAIDRAQPEDKPALIEEARVAKEEGIGPGIGPFIIKSPPRTEPAPLSSTKAPDIALVATKSPPPPAESSSSLSANAKPIKAPKKPSAKRLWSALRRTPG